MVRFEARGQPANARVLLIAGCTGVCVPRSRIGQKLLVYYSPQNLSYARLTAPGRHDPGDIFGIWVLAGFAALSLFVAAVNAVTRIRG